MFDWENALDNETEATRRALDWYNPTWKSLLREWKCETLLKGIRVLSGKMTPEQRSEFAIRWNDEARKLGLLWTKQDNT